VNPKIAGLKWMFIPLKMVLIGIDPYPHENCRVGLRLIQIGSMTSKKRTEPIHPKLEIKHVWLVILTIFKHISQKEGLSHISWKIKHV